MREGLLILYVGVREQRFHLSYGGHLTAKQRPQYEGEVLCAPLLTQENLQLILLHR